MSNSKASPQNRQSLAALICKYLKFLQMVKSASVNTSKSYATDLGQFLKPWGIEIFISVEDCKTYNVICEPKSCEVLWSESELLALAQQALLNWAPLAASSRNRKVAALKAFFKWMFQEEILTSPLHHSLKAPKVPQKIPHYISMDEALAVIQSLKTDLEAGRGVHQELSLFLLLYGGGLRVSEACQLKWNQLHLEEAQLRILGKGGKERVVSLPSAALNWFKKQPQADVYIWGATPLNPRTAYEWIRQRGARAGLLKPLHPHALRHSYATHLLAGGMDLRILQEALGHSSLVATQKYTHLEMDQLARTLSRHHPLSKIAK